MADQWDQQAILNESTFTWPYRKDIETPNVMALVGNLQNKAVLDYGCGAGSYSRLFKISGAERVVGYDISEGMLRHAKERETKEALGIEYTSSLIPDLNGQFDLVMSGYVLPYAFTQQDLHAMCAEMARVLRPGGHLMAVIVNPDFNTTPNHYDDFGCRYLASSHDKDCEEMEFELCRPSYSKRFKFCYHSKANLEKAFADAGFCETQWRKPIIYGPCPIEDAPENVRIYFENPIFAILECFLETKPKLL